LDHPAIYTPALQLTNRGAVEFVNNVVYNWGHTASYGGERGWWNFENNWFKPGPASRNPDRQFTEISVSESTSMRPGSYHIAGNVLEGAPEISADNWRGVRIEGGYSRAQVDNVRPFPVAVPLPREDAATAYERVLAEAGASHRRDAVDTRIVSEARNGEAVGTGIIDSQSQVGGWPVLKKGKPEKDSDGDGIPNRWERKNHLSPRDPSDGEANLERWLNDILTAR
jgi:hypothetical protein